jgi:hypothetical protein
MTTGTRRAVSMGPACGASDDSAAAARRTGCGQRAAQVTGTRWLALVTCGAWSAATTPVAPWAAQVPHVAAPGAGAPAALPPRLHPRALAGLQERLRPARATVHAGAHVGAAGLWSACPRVSRAARTGWALPASRHALWPGSGGSAAPAGATRHAGWDAPRRVGGPGARPPWHMPEQPSGDPVGACAPHGRRWLCDGGSCQSHACARLAAAGASVVRRLHPPPTRFPPAAGPGHPLALASWRATGAGDRTAPALCRGAPERGAGRRVASRRPAGLVKASRRRAHTPATHTGAPPSTAPRARCAWPLVLPTVPPTIGHTAPRRSVSPLRGHVERLVQSWTSARPGASLTTKKVTPPCGYLDGRMLRVVRHAARCPPVRATWWATQHRERSVRTLVRPVQTVADGWMDALVPSALVLRRLLPRTCPTAARLVATAPRTRHTTAPRLRERVATQDETVALMEAVNA